MLQCGSNAEVIKGNLCSMNCEMEIAQPAKISILLYMMKIVIKSDAGMYGAAFFASGWGEVGRGGASRRNIFGVGRGGE